ncbi:MAG: carbohydrate ABC transporter permease [Herpetosiphon sp.]
MIVPHRTATGPSLSSRALILAFFVAFAAYCLLPASWLLFASTKSTADLYGSFGFWFAKFNFFVNLRRLGTQSGGIFIRWMLNSVLYAGVGGFLSMVISSLAGFALAKYKFAGRELIFNIILGGVLIPSAVLALPLFLLLSRIGLTNSYLGVLLPSLVSPFGVYLSRVYAAASVPDELLEAARVDGSSEMRTYMTIVMPILAPALVTVFLFQFVAIWNNFFLPLVVLSRNDLFPVTLGLYAWQGQALGNPDIVSLVITGSLVASLPLVVLFFMLQQYWRAGATAGAVKG